MNQNDIEAAIRDLIEDLQTRNGFSTATIVDALADLTFEFRALAEDEERS